MTDRSLRRWAIAAALVWLLTLPALVFATARWGPPWPGVAQAAVIVVVAHAASAYRGRHRAPASVLRRRRLR